MATSSTSSWIVVNNTRTRTASQSADNNLLKYVSPEELREQQRLLEHYRRKKNKLERIEDEESNPGRPTNTTSPRPRRLLRGSTSPVEQKHVRMPTVSSTGATVGDLDQEVPFPTVPALPSEQRRHVRPQAQPTVSRHPIRTQSGPSHLQPGTTLLNVNMIGASSSSPPSASPQLRQNYSFPTIPTPVIYSPPLELQSLPPGYDFALTAQFSADANALRPLRVLSLDGGGVRGISSLRILKAIMDRIRPGARPCQYFDLICGTSTGGLIAIMLGRLRMSVDDCIKQYHHLVKKIFNRNIVAQAGSFATGENRFSPVNLEQGIKSVVAKVSPQNTKMADHHGKCARTFVVAVKKHNVNNQPARRIRTYPTRSSPADTCEIWEAGRATSAAPSYFPPIKLNDERGRLISYIDGGFGYNNPSKELLNEAREVFGPEHPIGCFISIGTGRVKNTALGGLRKPGFAGYDAFRAIVTSSEKAHQEMEQYFSRMPDVYFRFNAGTRLLGADGDDDFVQAVGLEDWQKMGQIEDLTQVYLQERQTTQNISKCVEKLVRVSQ